MKIKFRAFASILIGMTLIGSSVGFLTGYYFHLDFSGQYWMYIASPIMGIGCGLVIYGSLFERNMDI
jgi:hypothetical protein